MAFRVLLVSPERRISEDPRPPATTGVGDAGPMVSLLAALAALGHDVTACVDCAEPMEYQGVRYRPIDHLERVDTDVLIAMSAGGEPSFAALHGIPIQASLRVVWVQDVRPPADLDLVAPDYLCAASNFLRDACVERWGLPPERLFVCYNGLRQDRFAAAETHPVPRDPYALTYIGPPEKGVEGSLRVLRRLRAYDERYHLDVFGETPAAGRDDDPARPEPGVRFRGMLGPAELIPELFGYEYCLAPQPMEGELGIGILEAKRAGQIVLASNSGSFHEMFRSSWDGFLLQPHESDGLHDAMADRVLQLAREPQRRERIRRRGQRTPWDWGLAAETWTAWWDEVLGHRPAACVTGPDGERLISLPDGRHSARTGLYFPDVYPASPLLDRLGPTNRVLVGGYYGHGNLGDETILHVMLEELREALPNISAVVASGDPVATRRTHDVDAVSERDIPALFEAAAASDLILLGGGGLFQDYQGVDPATLLTELHWGLTYFDAFPALAILTHKPFMLYAVGIGPLSTLEGGRYTRLAFERANAATVRDRGSLDLLSAIGVPIERVSMAADPAYLVDPAPADQIQDLLDDLGFVERPTCLVAVALREWDAGGGLDWVDAVAGALDRFVEAHDASVLFVPFQAAGADPGTNDGAVAARVSARLQRVERATICDVPLDAAQASGLLGACDLVLAMRLHATILAAGASVPVVALAYDPKVAAAMHQIGLEAFSLDLSDVTPERIFERLESCYLDRSALGARLAVAVPRLRAEVAASTAHVVSLLAQRPFEPEPAPLEWLGLLRDALVWHFRQVEALQAGNTLLASEAEGARARVAQQSSEAEGARLRMWQLVSDLDDANVRVAQLDSDLDDANARVAQLVSDAEVAREHVARLTTEMEETSRARDDLSDTLASAITAREAIEAELRAIRDSRAWRTIMILHRGRRAIEDAVRHPWTRTTAWVGAMLGPSLRNRVRRLIDRLWMNPYAHAFDLYRRDRASMYGSLTGVSAASEMGLVSIVLPVHNGEAMIAEAIESVLNQSYSRLELIVVDDGSADDTVRIVTEYCQRDPRVRVIRQENQKLPRALSRGFREARGEFLTWTSDDNRLKPDCLERLVGSLRRHPCWDMTYANMDLIGEDGVYLRGSSYYEGYQRPHGSEHIHLPESTVELNVWPNNSVGAAFLYRSRVPALIGDYSAARFTLEDYDYWMRVNALLTLRHAGFDEPVYDYRFHDRSLTSRAAELRILENREHLMVFDDFRRDAYLSPLVWIVEGDEVPATVLRREIRDRRHLLYDGKYALDDLPRLFVPIVYVRMTSGAQVVTAPRADLPPHTLTVVVTADAVLPDSAAAEWSLCFAIGSPARLPRLDRPHQGWLAAADVAALVHAIDIRAKSENLARFEADADVSRPDACAASVVLCTHRFGPGVVSAIRSALRQRFDRPYEVLLVNNAPATIDRVMVMAALGDELQPLDSVRFRVVVCPVIGLSAARNAGLAEAAGEIVCFLDDDAVAEETWLARLCEAFEAHPNAGVIGGHIHLKIPSPRPRALRPGWEKYWSHFVTGFKSYTEVEHWWEFPWGANWAARRTALLLAGGFRSRYGRVGDNAWGGEELVAAAVVRRLGYSIGVLPDAVVVHDVDPARFTFRHVLRTLVAGHQVGYLSQRDLYLPLESGLRTTLWQIVAHHFDASIPSHEGRWRNAVYRKCAQVRLLLTQIRDVGYRVRKPVVVTDPCDGA